MLLAGSFLVGCDSVKYIMTYESPTSFTKEELDVKFSKLNRVSNVFDGAVVVRGGIDDNYPFEEKSSVYKFESGESVFRTYSLPLNATNINISIESKIGTTMFAPSVALLNKQKELVKIFNFSNFQYRPLSDFSSENVSFKFSLNNFSAGEKAIAYMVVFTTDRDLETKTTITHPAKLYAIAHREAIPDIADPQIPHARLGEINVKVSLESTTTDALTDFWDSLKGPLWGGEEKHYMNDDDDGEVDRSKREVRNSNITTSDGTAVTVINPKSSYSTNDSKETVEPKQKESFDNQKSNVKASMLKETEDMYNSMIITAVKSGDISKAMKLAAEATNAGSLTANKTLNNALNNRK